MVERKYDPHQELLDSIKMHIPQLLEVKKRLDEIENSIMYRFYHHSIKVFGYQDAVQRAIDLIYEIKPESEQFYTAQSDYQREHHQFIGLDGFFGVIVSEGTRRTFTNADNARWLYSTRAILETYFHVRYYINACLHCGQSMVTAPNGLSEEWAAVLYLFRVRTLKPE
jgi:hypothetical protein